MSACLNPSCRHVQPPERLLQSFAALTCLLHRGNDLPVARTTAKIPLQGSLYLCFRWMGVEPPSIGSRDRDCPGGESLPLYGLQEDRCRGAEGKSEPRMTAAVVLAAGHADRMGSNKLTLPLGSGTVVGRVVATALAACDRVIVVIGLHDQGTKTAVEQTARSLGAEGRLDVVEGVPYDPGMFISIQAGLRRVTGADVVLIFPGDIPLTLPETAIAVRDAVSAGEVDVAVPSCSGRRGHPVAISARGVPELLAMSE